jgi:excisionase family DNA binding protein
MPHTSQQLVTIDTVAIMLSLTKRGVESLVARKVIPAFKISRRCLRFRMSEVEDALVRYRQAEIH